MTVMQIQPAAGRDPFAARRVAVYKNLHDRAWCIRALDGPHKGKVVAHATAVALIDCHMHVGVAARRRVVSGKPREVHAWIVGTLAPVEPQRPQRISYRPHQRGEFFIVDTGHPIWTAPAVVFTDAAYTDAA